MKIKYTFLSVLAMLAFSTTQSLGQCEYNTVYFDGNLIPDCEYDWLLVWGDEFEGNELDDEKWFTNPQGPAPADITLYHGCNSEKQAYLEDNVEVADGLLHLNVKQEVYVYSEIAESTNTCDDGTNLWTEGELYTKIFFYTSGWINSKKNFSPTKSLKIG